MPRRRKPVRQQIVNQVGKEGYMGVVQTYDSRYQGVKGSPYLHAGWLPGELEYINGKIFEKVSMK